MGDDRGRVQNNVQTNYTANRNATYQTVPNNVHTGYTSRNRSNVRSETGYTSRNRSNVRSETGYTSQNRSNVRSETVPRHYVVSAYAADDDNQSRNYQTSRYAHAGYIGDEMRNHQSSSSRASQQPSRKKPHYSYAASQEQPVWKPKARGC